MAQSLRSSNDIAKFAKATGAFGASPSYRFEMGIRKWVGNPAAVDDFLLNVDPHVSLRIYEGAPDSIQLNYYGEGLSDALAWHETGYTSGPLATDEFLIRLQFDHANTRVILEVWDYYGNRHAQKIITGVAAATWSPGEITAIKTPAGTSGELDFLRVYTTVLAPGAAAPDRATPGTPVHAWEFDAGTLVDTGSGSAINLVWQGGGAPAFGVEPFAPTVAPVLSSAIYSTGPDRVDLVFTDPNSGSTNETHVDVERAEGTSGNWRAIGWALGDTTTYRDGLVKHGISYDYRVRARNRFGVTAYSGVVTVVAGAGADTNPVIVENAKTGTAAWNLANPATAQEIEGYCDATSYNRGGTVNFKVNSASGQNFNLEVFRMGWYGGLGARRVRNVTGITGTAQTIAAESDQGSSRYIREMAWTTSYSLALTDADPTEWTSGIYLARLTRVTDGKQAYTVFCVRDDTRQSKYLYNQPVNTYQAYNAWPNTQAVYSGRGTYAFNSTGSATTKEVSFNRPYGISARVDGAYGIGAGDLLSLLSAPSALYASRELRTASTELNFLRWAEKEGYDVQYCTDLDLHASGESLWRRCYTILFPGHQEYWSRAMRDTVRAARDYGRHLAFLGANAAYWQVLVQPAFVAGTPNRALFTAKDLGGGGFGINNSIRWRDLPIAHPDGYEAEWNLVGVQYAGDPKGEGTMQIELAGTDPLMAGTGLTTGDTVPGIVGYEWDNEVIEGAAAKAGRKRIAHSAFVGGAGYAGGSSTSDMVYYTNAPSAGPAVHAGAKVLGSGTLQLPWALDDYGVGLGRPTSFLHTGMQQLVRNILADQGEAVITSGGGGGGGGAGIADHLDVIQQPAGFAFGSSCTTPAIVAVKDALGNVVADYSGTITVLGLGSSLTGPTILQVYNGLATFRRLACRTMGSLTLAFSSAGLAGASAASVTVTAQTGTFRGVCELPRVVPVQVYPAAPIVQVVSGAALQAALNIAAARTAASGGLLDYTFVVNDGVAPAFVWPNRPADATGIISVEGTSAPCAIGTRAIPAMMGARARFESSDGSVPAVATALSDGSTVAHHYRLAYCTATMTDPSFSYFCLSYGTAGPDQDTLAKEPHHLYLDRVVADGGAVDIFHVLGANCRHLCATDTSFLNGHHFSQDGNAIACWNGSGEHFFGNCDIQGSGEGYIYGGSDSSIPELVPSDITFAACRNSRPLTWNRNDFPLTGWEVKNNVDLKNCARLHEYGNEVSNSWVDGQSGSLYNIKSVNQDDGAPWSGSSDVVIELGVRRNAQVIFALGGNPEGKECSPLSRVLLTNNVAWNCPQHVTHGGGGHFDVSVIHDTYNGGATGLGLHAGEDGDFNQRYTYRDNIATADLLSSVNAQGLVMPGALDRLPGAVFSPNVWGNADPLYGVGSDFPAGNFVDGVTTATIGFTLPDPTGWDTADMAAVVGRFRLLPASAYHLTASDGLDFGADIDAILAALGGIVAPPPATAVALGLVTEASGGHVGIAFPTQPLVEILDPGGARVTSSTVLVTAAYYTGTGTLLGTTIVAAIAGLATFAGLAASMAGAKVIRYTSPGLTPVDNVSIVITSGVWGAADTLRRFKRMAGLPDVNEESDDTDLYPILSSAQGEVVRQIAIRYPHSLYSMQGPTLLTPSADRKTFSFGNDGNGNPIIPLGWVQINPRKSAFVGDHSYFWREGLEFMDEGTQIRIPGDRTYAGDLWGRWIPTPPDITSTTDPVLQPADARELIVIKAVELWAGEGNTRPDLVDRMEQEWGKKFPVWMLNYKRRFRGGGGLLDPAKWWLYSPDLTNGG